MANLDEFQHVKRDVSKLRNALRERLADLERRIKEANERIAALEKRRAQK